MTKLKLEEIKTLFTKEYGNLSLDIMTLLCKIDKVDYKIWKIKDKYFVYEV